MAAINVYLIALHAEASERGYAFDPGKLVRARAAKIPVSDGQLAFELAHLRAKLRERDPARSRTLPKRATDMQAHPLFRVVAGPVEEWELAAK